MDLLRSSASHGDVIDAASPVLGRRCSDALALMNALWCADDTAAPLFDDPNAAVRDRADLQWPAGDGDGGQGEQPEVAVERIMAAMVAAVAERASSLSGSGYDDERESTSPEAAAAERPPPPVGATASFEGVRAGEGGAAAGGVPGSVPAAQAQAGLRPAEAGTGGSRMAGVQREPDAAGDSDGQRAAAADAGESTASAAAGRTLEGAATEPAAGGKGSAAAAGGMAGALPPAVADEAAAAATDVSAAVAAAAAAEEAAVADKEAAAASVTAAGGVSPKSKGGGGGSLGSIGEGGGLQLMVLLSTGEELQWSGQGDDRVALLVAQASLRARCGRGCALGQPGAWMGYAGCLD